MQDVLTSDVIAALLAHVELEPDAGGGDPTFEGNPSQIHAAFQTVANQYEDLLGDLSFGRPGTFIRSHEIAGALDTLTMDGFLSCANPDLVVYTIRRDKLREYFDSHLAARFEFAGVIDELPEAAGLFETKLRELRESDNAWDLVVVP
jgi:hypothetical protein